MNVISYSPSRFVLHSGGRESNRNATAALSIPRSTRTTPCGSDCGSTHHGGGKTTNSSADGFYNRLIATVLCRRVSSRDTQRPRRRRGVAPRYVRTTDCGVVMLADV